MRGERSAISVGPASLKVAAGVWALLTSSAYPADAQPDDPTSVPLQEILVTATKRDTTLLETPISMTVIGPEILNTAHVDAVADFERLVPGLTAIISGPGQQRYALRGLQSAGGPEVALYYDDIPISGLPGGSLDTGADQPDLKLWDVDRIEVLRGPQGTLYRNGSMGGLDPNHLEASGPLSVWCSNRNRRRVHTRRIAVLGGKRNAQCASFGRPPGNSRHLLRPARERLDRRYCSRRYRTSAARRAASELGAY